jgi:hypothetical protein
LNHVKHQKRLHLSALIAIAATVAVAGCGGGSSSSGTNASASNAAANAGGGRRAAIAACLKKQGLSVPQRPRGQGRGGPGLFGGGAGGGGGRFQSSQFRAALRKCGINPPAGRRFNGAMYRQAITKFAACVRRNGYNLPAPNFSGKGPVFDPSKVNRNDPKFIAAARKCQGLLRFRRPGAPPGAGASA